MNSPTYFKPETNQPYSLRLKYPTPREVSGTWGPQLLWMLSDGQRLYTPLSVGAQIEDLKLKAGETFILIKRKTGQSVEWAIERPGKPQAAPFPAESNGKAPVQPATPAARILESIPSLDSVLSDDETRTIPRKPPTQLESALKTAISAAKEAEAHATAIGYTCRFGPADIKAMAISLLIGMQNGRNAA